MSWLTAGFEVFEAELAVRDWCAAVRPAALAAAADSGLRRQWLRHGGTWFVGVDALPNDGAGRVPGGPPLRGAALSAAEAVSGPLHLHPAQVSVTYPGYPRRDATEDDSAHRFRRDRDAAHLDGLLPMGPGKRRHLCEYHAWILGICLTEADAGAAPLVVWPGSQRILREALAPILSAVAPGEWPGLDLTETYRAARRTVFERCDRTEVPLRPGQAVLVHRHAIHGVAPWAEGARADDHGRVIVYLRPELPGRADWLRLP